MDSSSVNRSRQMFGEGNQIQQPASGVQAAQTAQVLTPVEGVTVQESQIASPVPTENASQLIGAIKDGTEFNPDVIDFPGKTRSEDEKLKAIVYQTTITGELPTTNGIKEFNPDILDFPVGIADSDPQSPTIQKTPVSNQAVSQSSTSDSPDIIANQYRVQFSKECPEIFFKKELEKFSDLILDKKVKDLGFSSAEKVQFRIQIEKAKAHLSELKQSEHKATDQCSASLQSLEDLYYQEVTMLDTLDSIHLRLKLGDSKARTDMKQFLEQNKHLLKIEMYRPNQSHPPNYNPAWEPAVVGYKAERKVNQIFQLLTEQKRDCDRPAHGSPEEKALILMNVYNAMCKSAEIDMNHTSYHDIKHTKITHQHFQMLELVGIQPIRNDLSLEHALQLVENKLADSGAQKFLEDPRPYWLPLDNYIKQIIFDPQAEQDAQSIPARSDNNDNRPEKYAIGKERWIAQYEELKGENINIPMTLETEITLIQDLIQRDLAKGKAALDVFSEKYYQSNEYQNNQDSSIATAINNARKLVHRNEGSYKSHLMSNDMTWRHRDFIVPTIDFHPVTKQDQGILRKAFRKGAEPPWMGPDLSLLES
ncbi:MAG: hypothetical protein AB7I41_10780 [Candidatus Sericytochromatia bacterium]